MSGNSKQIDLDEILFEVCSSQPIRKLFVQAWVKIESEEDLMSLWITDVDWTLISLGIWDDEEALKDEIREIDVMNNSVIQPGCYIMRALFDIKTDSDDYRRWDYLESKMVEFDFMCTIEEHDNPVLGFVGVDESLTFFNL